MFESRILNDSIGIRLKNAAHLGKKILVAIFSVIVYRLLSFSKKESESNDILLHFVEFSSVHNSERSSNATRLNLANDKMYRNNAGFRPFPE